MKSLTAIFVLALAFAPSALGQDPSSAPGTEPCQENSTASECDPCPDGQTASGESCGETCHDGKTTSGEACDPPYEKEGDCDPCEGMSSEECRDQYCAEHPDQCKDPCEGMTHEECRDQYCAEHPDQCKDPCEGMSPEECKQHYCAEHPDACQGDCAGSNQAACYTAHCEEQGDCRHDPTMPPCSEAAGCDDQAPPLRHISFDVHEETMTMFEYTVSGHLIFESITIGGGTPEGVEARMHGSVLVVKGDDWELRMHDNPTGTISYKGVHDLILTLPADAQVQLRDHGARIVYAENGFGILASKALSVDGQTLVVSEQMAFHVKPAGDFRQDDKDDDEVRAAQARGHVGGEIKIRSSARAQSDNADQVEVIQYDDVTMTVKAPEKATVDDPLVVTFDADLQEGRTFVLDVDPALIVGPELQLRYFDVADDGHRTEVVFQQADSLVDVLDATAGTQPEYWVVQDADGWQVLVKVPNWSVHEITIASIGEFVTQPSVLIGIGAGVAGVAVASIVMLRPRREDL